MRRRNELHVAPGLALDADYVAGGSLGVLSKKGAGKTHPGRVLAEEMFAAKVQVVVVDPMGAWWGLRSSADGEQEGLPSRSSAACTATRRSSRRPAR